MMRDGSIQSYAAPDEVAYFIGTYSYSVPWWPDCPSSVWGN
jgi:hypothetical protein